MLASLPQWVKDLNVGIVALVLNLVVLIAMSATTAPALAVPAE